MKALPASTEPEYDSLETFAEYLADDDRDMFTHIDLEKLSDRLGRSNLWWRRELEKYGFKLAKRAKEREEAEWNAYD